VAARSRALTLFRAKAGLTFLSSNCSTQRDLASKLDVRLGVAQDSVAGVGNFRCHYIRSGPHLGRFHRSALERGHLAPRKLQAAPAQLPGCSTLKLSRLARAEQVQGGGSSRRYRGPPFASLRRAALWCWSIRSRVLRRNDSASDSACDFICVSKFCRLCDRQNDHGG
jgi:hypothetical protein